MPKAYIKQTERIYAMQYDGSQWDGHTSDDVLVRMLFLFSGKTTEE